MGSSLPPKASIDLVASYARSCGDDVEIVLADPDDILEGETRAVLRRQPAGRRVICSLELVEGEDHRAYVVRCPRRELSNGTWAVILRTATERQRVNARLLVQGERPLCLLWGAKAGPSKPPLPYEQRPRPRPPVRTRAISRLRSAARRVVPG